MNEIHIVGLMLQTTRERCHEVAEFASHLRGAEVRASDVTGKLVVVCECESADETMALVSQMRDMPGVLNVALVYQHVESAEAMNEEIHDPSNHG